MKTAVDRSTQLDFFRLEQLIDVASTPIEPPIFYDPLGNSQIHCVAIYMVDFGGFELPVSLTLRESGTLTTGITPALFTLDSTGIREVAYPGVPETNSMARIRLGRLTVGGSDYYHRIMEAATIPPPQSPDPHFSDSKNYSTPVTRPLRFNHPSSTLSSTVSVYCHYETRVVGGGTYFLQQRMA